MFNLYKSCEIISSTKNITKLDDELFVLTTIKVKYNNTILKLCTVIKTVNDEIQYPAKFIIQNEKETLERFVVWKYDYLNLEKITELIDIINTMWERSPKENTFVY